MNFFVVIYRYMWAAPLSSRVLIHKKKTTAAAGATDCGEALPAHVVSPFVNVLHFKN